MNYLQLLKATEITERLGFSNYDLGKLFGVEPSEFRTRKVQITKAQVAQVGDVVIVHIPVGDDRHVVVMVGSDLSHIVEGRANG
jgi:hypothetical protein